MGNGVVDLRRPIIGGIDKMSSSSLGYLERKRIFLPLRQRPLFAPGASKVHTRPVRHLPDLLGADHPADRLLSQTEADRIPYEGAATCCPD